MKTLDWKTIGRRAAVIGISSLLFVACGQENKTNSANHNNGDGYFNPDQPGFGGNNSGVPGGVESDVTYLKQNYHCQNGQRLPDIHMSVTQGSGSNTTIQGQFQSGHVSGNHAATYAGANYGTRDLIFVTKVTDGQGQVAYNFRLSLCPQYNQGSGAEIIGQNTEYMSMDMIQGFNLDHDVNCAIGNVDVGGIRFTTDTHPTPHERLFSKICHN